MKYNEHETMEPSKIPADRAMLLETMDSMSASELAEAMENALGTMTVDTYDGELIDAFLDALNRKAPVPEIPNAADSYAQFEVRAQAALSSIPSNEKPVVKRRKGFRTALVAAATIVFVFASMIVAQAAGLDVFGAMARWTGEVFSFGDISDEGATDLPDGEAVYSTLQEALDAYGVTEVAAPMWVPDEYTLLDVSVEYDAEDGWSCFFADYVAGETHLTIQILGYFDMPSTQYEKIETPIEQFEISGTQFYIFQNTGTNVAAWFTEHFECSISGVIATEELKQMIESMPIQTEGAEQ